MRFFKKLNNIKAFICKNIPLGGMFFVFLYVCLLNPVVVKSQVESMQKDTLNDTTKIKKHSPKLAMIMSTVIPGLGQAYNKKYWKIPVIYAGIGTLGYMANRSNSRYKNFKKGYSELLASNNLDSTIFIYGTDFNLNGLDAGRNYYRRYRDLYVILTAGLYLLNIVDANVDAHLFDFDISDDISMRVAPSVEEYCMAGPVTGIKIKINFK